MTIQYLDFDIEVAPGDERTYLVVVRSPAGSVRRRSYFAWGQLELENRLLMLQNALLRSGGSRRKVLTHDELGVRNFGIGLFDSLFQEDVRSLFYESKRIATSQGKFLRVRLRILDPQMAALPWEYLFDTRQNEYLALAHSTPLIRYLEVAQPPQPLLITPPLRILGMIASPSDATPLKVEVEKERLERALADLITDGLVELTWLTGQTWRDLHRAMRPNQGPWHVFHFVGHGGFDEHRNQGLLVFADHEGKSELRSATDVARLLSGQPTLRLALLNACEGAYASRTDIFASTAATLVQQGIAAVIAMQYESTDHAAIEFSTQFYDAMTAGLPVDSAVTDARRAMSLAINNTLEWGIPVLYMRSPDGVIFAFEKQGVGVEEKTIERSITNSHEAAARIAQPKQLTGIQIQALWQALLDGYTASSLAQLVRFQLHERLDAIAGGDNFSDRVYNLIDWAERTGQIEALITGAQASNPGNQRLRQVASDILGNTSGLMTFFDQAHSFFVQAGFETKVMGTNAFMVATSKWPSHSKYGNIYAKIVNDNLSGDIIRGLEQDIEMFGACSEIAYIIYDGELLDDAFLQMAAYKIGKGLAVIPMKTSIITSTLISEDEKCYGRLKSLESDYAGYRNLYESSSAISDPTWFFGRRHDVDEIMQRTEALQHTGIFGMRKIGKTSLLLNLRQQYSRKSIPVAYLGLQKIGTQPISLFTEIVRQLHHYFDAIGVKDLPECKLLTSSKAEKSSDLFRDDILMFRDVAQQEFGKSYIVIMIDEVERIVPFPNGKMTDYQKYDDFFSLIRDLSQVDQCLVSIVTGENPLIRKEFDQKSVSNTMFELYDERYLQNFSYQDCKDMIVKIGAWMGFAYSEGSLQLIFDETAGHPYIARTLCATIIKGLEKDMVSVADVTRGIQEASDRLHEFFSAWGKKLTDAENILIESIIKNNLVLNNLDEQQKEAQRHLEKQGILRMVSNGQLEIASRMLKRWLE